MDHEVGLIRREVNVIMGCLKRKNHNKTFNANDVIHKAFDLLFEAHEANLFQLPFNDQVVHDVLMN